VRLFAMKDVSSVAASRYGILDINLSRTTKTKYFANTNRLVSC